MKRLVLLMVGLAFCTHCTEGRQPHAIDSLKPGDSDAAITQKQKEVGPVTPGKAAAQRAYIDPETGEFVTPPEPDVSTANPSRSLSPPGSPAEKMEEESSPVPGGGIMVDLKGRFQNPLSATIEDNGKTKIGHPASDQME